MADSSLGFKDRIKYKVLSTKSRIFNIVIYSNLWIAAGATAMFAFTAKTAHINLSYLCYAFIFCSTLCCYSLHWSFVKGEGHGREYWSKQHQSWLLGFFMSSGTVLLYFLWIFKAEWRYLLPVSLLTLLYSVPNILKPFQHSFFWFFKVKTIYLASIWFVVTCLFPFFLSQTPILSSNYGFLAHQWVFLVTLCLLFDYKDRQKESENILVRLLIPRFWPFWSVLALFLLVLGVSTIPLYKTLKITLLTDFCLFILGLLSRYTQNDKWYYGVLDGILILPWILSLNF